MSVSVADFWKLLADSRLLTAEQCRQFAEEAARVQPDAAADPQRLAKWLIQSNKITRYQAKVLLAGRPGPFFYGEYCVYDRADAGRLAGLFRARHLPTRQPVGLRFLAGPALQNAEAIGRLGPRVRAARQASRHQPRLSQCYHLADLGAYKFIVLEDLRGESLAERLTRSKAALSPAEACRIVRQVALGLAGLHAQGEAHGQIRPDHVWLAPEGAKLLQFPLLGDPLAPAVTPANVEAQLDYAAPELAASAAAGDPRSDVYSLGCLLYHLLVGETPFAGGSREQKLARHAREAPTPIAQRNPAVPAALAQVLGYLLEKSPDRRYPDAAAVAESLAPYAGGDAAMGEATLPDYEAWLEQLERGMPAAAPAVARAVPVVPATGEHPAGAHAGAGVLPAIPLAPAAMAPAVAAAPLGASARPVPVVPALMTEGAALSLAARRTKRGKTSATFGAVAFGAVVLVGTVLALWWSDQPTPEGASAANGNGPALPSHEEKLSALPATKPAATNETSDTAPLAADDRAEAIRSIGDTIWQSPTHGEPIDLAYLAPGCQLIVALRTAELLDQPEWEKLVDPRTLGAASGWLTGDLPKLTGKTLDQLESVLIGLLDASPGPPRLALVARATGPFVADELLTAWNDAKAEAVEGQTLYVARDRGFFLPDRGEGKILVVAPPAELRETVKQGDQPPALRRELELLAESSDAGRPLTVLAAPNFLFSGGKSLLAERLLDPLRGFLEIQDADQKLELPKGAMFSASLGDGSLFLELRIHDSFAGGSAVVGREYRHRVARLPKQVSGYVRDLRLSDYSKPVLWDYRDQLEVVDRYTRLGFEGKQIVLRAYLPEIAAHNLALGAHLALLENPGGPAASTPAATQAARPETIADKLNKKTSLAFPSNTLETSIKLLSDDIGVEMIILGGDLQVDGITKNQSFALDEKDQPAHAILRTIMKKANPAGNLVYVIKKKDGSDQEALYVTTRAAVKKRGDKLPPGLEKK